MTATFMPKLLGSTPAERIRSARGRRLRGHGDSPTVLRHATGVDVPPRSSRRSVPALAVFPNEEVAGLSPSHRSSAEATALHGGPLSAMSKACTKTRPPLRTVMLRSCPSRRDIPKKRDARDCIRWNVSDDAVPGHPDAIHVELRHAAVRRNRLAVGPVGQPEPPPPTKGGSGSRCSRRQPRRRRPETARQDLGEEASRRPGRHR